MLFKMFNSMERFPISILKQKPSAVASLNGKEGFSSLKGEVLFFQAQKGVLVWVQISSSLPVKEPCGANFFGLHIHEGGACEDSFNSAEGHYNPNACLHPAHAGDLPSVLGLSSGKAFICFLTDKFQIDEIIGKTVILHKYADDLNSQPAGESGERIACGIIVKT